MRSRRWMAVFLSLLVGAFGASIATAPHAFSGDKHHDFDDHGRDHDGDDDEDRGAQADERISLGFSIAPVQLDTHGRHRDLVGLGSYLVNAVAGCNDCHTCPSYAPGHSPYQNGDGRINTANYLGGGVHFGPFTSDNITPDFNGKPAGLTRDEFIQLIRTGHDPKPPHDLLQVMPWPVFRKMSDHDLRAIYEYLSSIPHATSGMACSGAGQ